MGALGHAVWFVAREEGPAYNKKVAGYGRLTAAFDPTGLIANGAGEWICYREES